MKKFLYVSPVSNHNFLGSVSLVALCRLVFLASPIAAYGIGAALLRFLSTFL